MREIADIVGEPAAVLLAARVGGTRVFVPAKVSDGHWLVDCIGRQKAELLASHYAVDGRGMRIDVPLGGGGAYPQLRRTIAKRVHDMDKSNASSRTIARDVGITARTVHRHRAAHKGAKNKDQGSLF
ncbi:MAG: hypothetical protein GC182_02965 [Rhodopseudomonas sp.]|nr:hypothetical protein [Rhodopseudomonas sp.]